MLNSFNCNFSVFISELADNALDGHTGPVTDRLMGAGQAVKKSRFAAVRITNDCNDIFSHSLIH